MKRRKMFLLCGLLAVGTAFFMSCDDDEKSYLPTYKGFSFSDTNGQSLLRTNLTKGDTVIVTAVQAERGKLLNRTAYTWTITCGKKSYDFVSSGVASGTFSGVYDNSPSDPTCKFVVPDTTATVTVTFAGEFNYSAEGTSANSAPYNSDGSTISGSISQTSSGAIKGTVKGSVTFVPK